MHASAGGQLLWTRYIGDCALSEHVYLAESIVDRHGHDEEFLSFVLSGWFREIREGGLTDHDRRSVAFYPAYEEHEVITGRAPMRCLKIHFGRSMLARLSMDSIDLPFTRAEGGPLPWLMERIHAAVKTSGTELVLRGLLLEALASLVKIHDATPDAAPRWLLQLDRLLLEEFTRSWTIQELAAHFGIHPDHMARTWRKHRDGSIRSHLHHLRIEHACRRLEEGCTSLAELASEAGFADQTHFSTIFKQIVGMTPGAYRSASRGETEP